MKMWGRFREILGNKKLGMHWGFACAVAAVALTQAQPARAQQFIPCAPFGKQPLVTIPEISIPKAERDKGVNILKAVVITADEQRNLWLPNGNAPCSPQYLRYFMGYPAGASPDWWNQKINNLPPPLPTDPAFHEPIPGPTLRARVGDLVEITFLNYINPQDFGNSVDRGEKGLGCDEVVGSTPPASPDWQSTATYAHGSYIKPTSNNNGGYYFIGSPKDPKATSATSGTARPSFPQNQGGKVPDGGLIWTNAGTNPLIYPGSDVMPDCFHGSSTTNIHFHGTHTTPSTTGDNVLLQIRPSLRSNGKLVPTETDVKASFDGIFDWCEKNGSPAQWSQLTKLPGNFPAQQMGTSNTVPGGWIGDYDKQAAYKPMPLWPPNQQVINQHGWPQFYIGAFPYCFRLPKYNEVVKPDTKPTLMGQAPGTHWYHAHKHGSTDINVSDGMTGAFIIEGEYDDVLNAYYRNQGGLTQQVMVFQQLIAVPRILSSTGGGGAVIAVNGRRQPVVTMKPNEVQMWRLVNTNSRSLVTLCSFTATGTTPPTQPTPLWVQTAQDGVQFEPKSNYNPGNTNAVINMATGNRADLLVQAPTQPGTYQLNVQVGVAPVTAAACPTTGSTVLLNVSVQGTAVGKPNNFIPQNTSSPCVTSPNSFPCLPPYLDDITITDYDNHRGLIFNSVKNVPVPTAPNSNPNPKNPPFPGASVGRTSNSSHFIDNKQFEDHTVDQVMKLDTVEEWKISNLTATSGPGLIWHPFHIHINPFQVTELFDPNSMAQPLQLPPPWVWWDVFAIPAGLQTLSQCSQSSGTYTCPNPDGGSCSVQQVCTIPQGSSSVMAACSTAGVCPNPKYSCSSSPQQMCRGKIIPGFFTMRTRFADFTGQYVLHCHILAHEDRGMMQLIEVVPKTSIYGHD